MAMPMVSLAQMNVPAKATSLTQNTVPAKAKPKIVAPMKVPAKPVAPIKVPAKPVSVVQSLLLLSARGSIGNLARQEIDERQNIWKPRVDDDDDQQENSRMLGWIHKHEGFTDFQTEHLHIF